MSGYTDDLVVKTINWGLARNIIQGSDLKSQFKKLTEELFELEDGIEANNPDEIKDAIGDMAVVLIMMAEIYGRDYHPEDYVEGIPDIDEDSPYFETCLEHAYEQIKDRKGKLIDGVFVKEL